MAVLRVITGNTGAMGLMEGLWRSQGNQDLCVLPMALGVSVSASASRYVSAPSVEFPRSAPSSSCCNLKRTFGSTNLLLLSLDDADDTAEEEEEEEAGSPGPCLHSPCPKDNTEPIAPPVSDCWGPLTPPLH